MKAGLWCFSVVLLLAQNGLVAQLPPVFENVKSRLAVPEKEGAWMLEAITRGGFAGGGIGSFFITSKGELACASVRLKCKNKLDKTTLQQFAEQVSRLRSVEWRTAPLNPQCHDCVAVLVRLSVRQANGDVKMYLTYWDPTTMKNVPEPVLRVYDQILKMTSAG
jgi:hypothetical protein